MYGAERCRVERILLLTECLAPAGRRGVGIRQTAPSNGDLEYIDTNLQCNRVDQHGILATNPGNAEELAAAVLPFCCRYFYTDY